MVCASKYLLCDKISNFNENYKINKNNITIINKINLKIFIFKMLQLF